MVGTFSTAFRLIPMPPWTVFALLLFAPLLAADHGEFGNLWDRIQPGPHSVGFRLQRSVDLSRTINTAEKGTTLGVAIWYPAAKSSPAKPAMTQLDYRLLEFSKPLDEPARQAFLDSEAGQMVAWRHIGIVPLGLDQARASFDAQGRAVRNAIRAPGRFPVVLVLGGPWYLSTTAEILASHGYLVAAPVRFSDEWNDIPTLRFQGWIERSLRDAEFVLTELARDPSADMANISVLGHGGGGMQAMLLAMSNRSIRAVANIDAGNFSNRSSIDDLVLFHRRLVRVPYLYIVTADTRSGADRYAEFENMRLSRRYEVILENPDLRHHDLSNAGRAVSASLRIRGTAQEAVLRTYADVQETLVRFLDTQGRPAPASAVEPFTAWIRNMGASSSGYAVTIRDAVEPAPSVEQILGNLKEFTPERMREAHGRDPDAPTFQEAQLAKIVKAARASSQLPLAAQFASLSLELHPDSIMLHNLASATFEAAGDRAAARKTAERCGALQLPGSDWRAEAAQTECRERLQRLPE